jgi:hypothetical protein
MGGAGADAAKDALKYFEGRVPEVCVTCRHAFEARPGVRLCRSCLKVAHACFEAISAEEQAGTTTENT